MPNYPVWLKIWLADEEFEATGKLYVGENADHYLTIEDAVTVGEIIMSKLKTAALTVGESICDRCGFIIPEGVELE